MNNRMTADDGPSVEDLLSRIERAEQILVDAREPCSAMCERLLHPEGYVVCTCGATARNSKIEKALRVLRGGR
jgi:hypothetical protein